MFMKVLLSLFFVLLPMASWAGNEGSGGGDNYRADRDSAWFLGADKTINYCMDVAADFGVDREQLKIKVQAVFTQWHDYILQRRFMTLKQGLTAYKQASKLSYTGPCDGKMPTDLALYFGTTNQFVVASKKNYDNPVAIAKRVSYDGKKQWGSGFIWLANLYSLDQKGQYPNWKKPSHLHGILLHEAGHVFGSQHVQGTIMDSGIGSALKADSQFLESIDGFTELLTCYSCSYKGEVKDKRFTNNSGSLDDQSAAKRIFKTLVGREVIGTVTTGVKIESLPITGPNLRISYTLTDKGGTYSFDLPIRYHIWSRDEGQVAVQVWQEDSGGFDDEHHFLQGDMAHGIAYHTSIVSKTGQKFAVTLYKNMMLEGKLSAFMALDGEMENIFSTPYPTAP